MAIKQKLASLKVKAKKYAPYAQAVVSVAATAAAAYYMRENNRSKDVIAMREKIAKNAWPSIEVPQEYMEDMLENGATLRVRMFHDSHGNKSTQLTTSDDWSAEAQRRWENR